MCLFSEYKDHFEICCLGVISLGGVILEDNHDSMHVWRFMESVIGLSTIAIFASLDFECAICASSDQRQFSNVTDNTQIMIYFVMGCIATILQAITYCMMRLGGVIGSG